MNKKDERICETLYNLFHANPQYAGCVYLACPTGKEGPDISSFFEDMALHAETVIFPRMDDGCLTFPEDDEKNDAVVFIPSPALTEGGALQKSYKSYLQSRKNIRHRVGIAFQEKHSEKELPSSARELTDLVVTEEGVMLTNKLRGSQKN
ncbi:MAG: hypothetical protein K5985_04195 [Lachnospiraceae bacterium]|nr:hypothetical protein [Lachnospiraceae bacterium]